MTTNKHNNRSAYEPSKIEEDALRANFEGVQEGFDSVFSAEVPLTEKLPNPEDDGPNAAGNQNKYNDPNYKSDFDKFVEEHPTTDVSWEKKVWEILMQWQGSVVNTNQFLLPFIRKQIDRTREESKHITKSGRVMYMAGRKEVIDAVKEMIEELKHNDHKEGDGETREHHIRYSGHNNALQDLLHSLEALSNK